MVHSLHMVASLGLMDYGFQPRPILGVESYRLG
jgi:hypothetical protein